MRPGSVAAPSARCRAELREGVGHLERGSRRPGAAIDARLGLLGRVAGEQAERDGHAGLDPGQLEPARRLAGDEVEVRRLAADHAAERDHARVARVFASAIAAIGSSNAPGTGMTSTASRETPASSSAPSAESSSRLVISPLKRLTTIATVRRVPFGRPRAPSSRPGPQVAGGVAPRAALGGSCGPAAPRPGSAPRRGSSAGAAPLAGSATGRVSARRLAGSSSTGSSSS